MSAGFLGFDLKTAQSSAHISGIVYKVNKLSTVQNYFPGQIRQFGLLIIQYFLLINKHALKQKVQQQNRTNIDKQNKTKQQTKHGRKNRRTI